MSKNWRVIGASAATFAFALACTSPAPKAQNAQADTACRRAVSGTFLVTIRGDTGAFASRAILTLHGDGTIAAVDSRQHQGVQGSSFSSQQGAYRCAGPRLAQARTLNFGFPQNESVARSDWAITYDTATDSIAGTIALFIYSGVEGVDPFAQGGKPAGAFRFTGVRVAAPLK